MKTFAALLLALAAAGACAQTVWRCGPDGRSYSDVPCPEGRPFHATDDEPAAGERDAAERVARRERSLADRLREERLATERATPAGSGLGTLGAAPQVKPKKLAVAKTKRKPREKQGPPALLRPAAGGTWPTAVPSSPPLRG